MPRLSLAGAASLLAAPVVVILAALVSPTLSDEAAKQVAAAAGHHGAAIGGAVLQDVSIVLLLAGAAWLAASLAATPRAQALAVAGGVLAILGSLPVVYDDGVHTATLAIASGLDATQATALIHHVLSSAGVKAVEPFSLLGDLGLAVLGFAAARAGAPRWTAAALTVGAFGEGAGFATGTKAVVVAGFVLVLAGLVSIVWSLAGRGESVQARVVQPAR